MMVLLISTAMLALGVCVLNALFSYALANGISFPTCRYQFLMNDACATQAMRDEARACERRFARRGLIAAGVVLGAGAPFVILAS